MATISCLGALAQDSTHGDCSPIVKNVGGNVQITCSVLNNQIPVFTFKGELSSRTLGAFTNFVNSHQDDVVELDVSLDNREEGELYDVSRLAPPLVAAGSEVSQLAIFGKCGAELCSPDYTVNSGFVYFRTFYWIKGFFTIRKSGQVHRGHEEVFLDEVDKQDLLTRGRINRR
jgi:hypothetical protein